MRSLSRATHARAALPLVGLLTASGCATEPAAVKPPSTVLQSCFDIAADSSLSGDGQCASAAAQASSPAGALRTVSPAATCSKSGSYTAIWEIQGNGASSPLDGSTVTTRGTVTADFQKGTGGPYEPWGFYIQAHEPDCDGTTSDGILVYTGSYPKNITVGDVVEISGARVVEYQGPSSFLWEDTLTELSCGSGCSIKTVQAGYGLPAAEDYDPPQNDADALAYNEAREGMLVQVAIDATVVSPVNPYNELVMVRGTLQDRLHRDDGTHGQRIVVDGDGVAAARCGVDGLGYIKTFDTVTYSPKTGEVAYGPLTYNFNLYKIQQDDDRYCVGATAGDSSTYDPALNPAPAATSDVLTVASLNAYNFFDTSDDPYKNEPIASQAEYDLKSTKHAAAICNLDGLNQPLIIGLQEVENDAVLQKLASDVLNTCGVSYDWHTLPGPDDRSIQVGYLTRSDRVTVLAANDRQGCSSTNYNIDYETGDHVPDMSCTGSTPYYLFSRPPIHLEAQVTLAGQSRTLHIINNHFKSKLSSSTCTASDCTDRRVKQAQHVDSLVDDLLATDPSGFVLVMGDLNDFYSSEPLDALDKTYGVLSNLWSDLAGSPSSGQGTILRYSYMYNGVSQTLDHMLVSDALAALARVVSPRHVNADWPGELANDTSMFRSSDHDFLLVGFDFSSPGKLLISEVLYDVTGAEPGGEWIELYNASGTDLDISGYRLGDEETQGGGEGMLVFPAGTVIGAGQTLVVANRARDFNGDFGFYPDFEMMDSTAQIPDLLRDSSWASGSVGLSNSGDEVLLMDASYVLLDAVSYGNSSWAFSPSAPDVGAGHSLERCSSATDTDSAGDWRDQANPTPGAICS